MKHKGCSWNKLRDKKDTGWSRISIHKLVKTDHHVIKSTNLCIAVTCRIILIQHIRTSKLQFGGQTWQPHADLGF